MSTSVVLLANASSVPPSAQAMPETALAMDATFRTPAAPQTEIVELTSWCPIFWSWVTTAIREPSGDQA